MIGSFGTGFDDARGMAIQSDGKLVVAGVLQAAGSSSFAVTRYVGCPVASSMPKIVVMDGGSNLPNGSSRNFGRVAVGGAASRNFTIMNAGTAVLSGIALTIGGANAAEFSVTAAPASTVNPSATTTFSLRFSPVSAGPKSAVIRIASNDCNEDPFILNLTAGEATALEAWRMGYFGSPDNSGPGADFNDPDSDGIVNRLEFATASDPTLTSPPIGKLLKNGSTLEFTYTRRKEALEEMTFRREFSETLTGTWSNLGGTVETVLSDDGIVQEVKTTVPAGPTGKRFVRLRVTWQ